MGETLPILTKLLLNNQIVEMRKCVRQSRIHCINKLSREIKKLKEKKGTEEQKSKNLKKAERFVQEILFMKKTKDDEISKFALVNEKSMIDITNDMNETLENKALARLVHHPVVSEKVVNFRKKFPDWKESLFPLLEALGERYKKKKPAKKQVNRKSQVSHLEDTTSEVKLNKNAQLNHKSQLPSEENTSDMKLNKNSTEIIQNKSGTWTVRKLRNNKTTSNGVVQKKSINLKFHNRDESEKNSDLLSHPEKNKVIQYTGLSIKKTETDLGVENIQNNGQRPEKHDQPVDANNATSNVLSGAIDPFFLTKDNTEYISISAKDNTIDTELKPKIESQPKIQYHDKPNFNFTKYGKSTQSKNASSYKQPENSRKVLQRGNAASKSYKFESCNRSKENDALHPSWEAKKKLSQIVQFQGKKIKFDES